MSLHRRPGGSQVNVGLLRHALLGGTSLVSTPAFSADFTTLTSLPSWLSFSRASNAMVFDSTGTLTYAPNNLVTASDYTGASGGATRTATGLSDPDGGTNAIEVTFSGTNQEFLNTYSSLGGVKTINSVWVKGTSGQTIGLAPDDTSGSLFTLTGSWQQIYLAGTNANGNRYVDIGTFSGATARVVQVYKPVIAQVTYETTPRAQDQVLNSGSTYHGPRFDHAWNGSAWVATGLLIEEQRANLCIYATDLANAAWNGGTGSTVVSGVADLSGGTTGVTITANTGTSSHNISIDTPTSLTSGSTYTLTFYLKQGTAPYTIFGETLGNNWLWGSIKWSDLSLATSGTDSATITKRDMGNGVYAVSLTWVRDATNTARISISPYIASAATVGNNNYSYTGAGTETAIALACQLEVGPLPTSYIPTTTAAVTRSADIVQLTGAAASAAMAATASIIGEVEAPGTSGTRIIGSSNQASALQIFSDGISFYNGSVAITLSGLTWPGIHRGAVGYDGSGISLSEDGGTVSTSADTHSSHMIDAYLGSTGNNNFLNGHVRSLALYSSRLSDADLQAKSVVGAAF